MLFRVLELLYLRYRENAPTPIRVALLNMVAPRLTDVEVRVLWLGRACGIGFRELLLNVELKNAENMLSTLLKFVLEKLLVLVPGLPGLMFELHTWCPLGPDSILQVPPILPNPLLNLGFVTLGRHPWSSPWHVPPTLLLSVLCLIFSALQQLVIRPTSRACPARGLPRYRWWLAPGLVPGEEGG